MTFGQSVATFADRVLDKTLGTVEAGACVISHNQFCACISPGPCCASHGELLWVSFSCLGQCNQFHSNGVAHGTCKCCA